MSNALTIASLPTVDSGSVDSLDRYLRVIKTFPVLTAEEEHDYATRLKTTGDLDAAKGLIMSHLRLVASIARGYSGYGLPQADLIQEGNIGLMKAVRRFDPDRGVRLVSFAIHWIKAEIHEYIVRNWRLVKVATTKAQRKLFFNLRSMKQGSGSLQPDEVAHIARELKVKPEEVLEMEARMGGHEISLEGDSDDDSESHFSPIAYLPDPAAEPSQWLAEQQSEQSQMDGLANALDSLDERSRRIVQARWLHEGSGATLHDLAAEFGVSAERIRQIEQKAMQKMKSMIATA
ncbi:RNA polymerase sigma factor RpoH [Pseudomethylobacillus aquaticus]|uniref:RNA polymerase sigma factor RpoH n=1 Tax=Pseudomethylobacillus aquaticus TaxID=2676064 RepID=A0A3N0V6A5_9PROT|nr:RNA polymerase sigma factor RpoH [Pseudomethylobacillus aquaticus]ROH88326.1 RNA polymerase sigma factor RpoH [Pseudomethylobacillus aquaticus]